MVTCLREACQIASYSEPQYIWTVTGSGPNDVWLGGGALYRFNGTALMNRTDNPSQLEGIFGLSATSPNDVWLSGSDYPNAWHFDGTDWRAKKFDGGSSVYSIFARLPPQ